MYRGWGALVPVDDSPPWETRNYANLNKKNIIYSVFRNFAFRL